MNIHTIFFLYFSSKDYFSFAWESIHYLTTLTMRNVWCAYEQQFQNELYEKEWTLKWSAFVCSCGYVQQTIYTCIIYCVLSDSKVGGINAYKHTHTHNGTHPRHFAANRNKYVVCSLVIVHDHLPAKSVIFLRAEHVCAFDPALFHSKFNYNEFFQLHWEFQFRILWNLPVKYFIRILSSEFCNFNRIEHESQLRFEFHLMRIQVWRPQIECSIQMNFVIV